MRVRTATPNTVLENYVENKQLPGAVAGFLARGKLVVHTAAVGYRLRNKRPHS